MVLSWEEKKQKFQQPCAFFFILLLTLLITVYRQIWFYLNKKFIITICDVEADTLFSFFLRIFWQSLLRTASLFISAEEHNEVLPREDIGHKEEDHATVSSDNVVRMLPKINLTELKPQSLMDWLPEGLCVVL